MLITKLQLTLGSQAIQTINPFVLQKNVIQD